MWKRDDCCCCCSAVFAQRGRSREAEEQSPKESAAIVWEGKRKVKPKKGDEKRKTKKLMASRKSRKQQEKQTNNAQLQRPTQSCIHSKFHAFTTPPPHHHHHHQGSSAFSLIQHEGCGNAFGYKTSMTRIQDAAWSNPIKQINRQASNQSNQNRGWATSNQEEERNAKHNTNGWWEWNQAGQIKR